MKFWPLPCIVMLLAGPALAQGPGEATGKSLLVTRTTVAPEIDGVIGDDEWAGATVVEDFHQIEPIEFATPSERTRVYVMADRDTLYIAAKLWDSEPGLVSAQVLRQGDNIFDDDRFSVALDTFNDKRNGYWFQMNANGVRRQAIFQNTNDRNFDWRGIWRATGRRDADGWSAEMAIPLKSLSFDPDSDQWGIGFQRNIERRSEVIGWTSRNQQVNPGSAGTATGLRGLEQGMGLDIVPALSLRHDRQFDPEGDEQKVEPSLDVFYKITPALTAALTVNTDFSATEVDDRQVNLTRFGLFFPEKRAFFLQGADIFEFGGLTSNGNDAEFSGSSLENGRPFFSRRIGLSGDGTPVDLQVGGKLTGRIGDWNLGLLDVQQAAYDSVESRNLLVGRAVLNVFDESSLGLILTHGDPRSNRDNSVVGADFRYRNTRLPGGNVFEATAWYQQSDTEGIEGDDAAYGVNIGMPNETGLRLGIGVKELERNFFPALGFVNNPGIRDYTFESRYTMRRDGFVQLMYGTFDVQRVELLDAGLQTQVATLRPFVMETDSGEELELNYIATKEVLYEDFEIADGVVLTPGEYSFDEYKIQIQTGGHRALAGTVRFAIGDFFDGERTNIDGEITWRPSPHFAVSGEYEYNDIELPAGSFISRVVGVRTDIVFSSRLAWSNLVQYDNDSEVFGINSRLEWVPEMGRETYLVFNHALQDVDRDNRFRSQAADVVLKAGYTFRF